MVKAKQSESGLKLKSVKAELVSAVPCYSLSSSTSSSSSSFALVNPLEQSNSR